MANWIESDWPNIWITLSGGAVVVVVMRMKMVRMVMIITFAWWKLASVIGHWRANGCIGSLETIIESLNGLDLFTWCVCVSLCCPQSLIKLPDVCLPNDGQLPLDTSGHNLPVLLADFVCNYSPQIDRLPPQSPLANITHHWSKWPPLWTTSLQKKP